MSTSTELVPATKAEIIAWLRGDDITEDDNSDDLTYDLAVRIMTAADPDAVLAKDDIRPSKSLVGESFLVQSVTWRKSTKSEDGAGRYAVMSCVDADGVKFLSSCGATKVVFQLRKYEVEGWLPARVQFDSYDTSNGRTGYELAIAQGDF